LTGDAPIGTPEEIADNVVKTMNEVQAEAFDGDEKLIEHKTLYVPYEVTEPWQVAVGGDNVEGYVWIDGYGEDLKEPFTWEEIDCL
jgi:hypothetical protein